MSLKGSAQEQDSTNDEMHQLRSELQLMMGEASIDDASHDGDDDRVHEQQRPIGVHQR